MCLLRRPPAKVFVRRVFRLNMAEACTLYMPNEKLFLVQGENHSMLLVDLSSRSNALFFNRTLKSPQLLELSGIGSKDVLEKIKVPVQIDLPGVGENVQEHIFVHLSWGTAPSPFFRVCVELIVGITEIKEDYKFDTLDLLRDPVLAAKHRELQYVLPPTPDSLSLRY